MNNMMNLWGYEPLLDNRKVSIRVMDEAYIRKSDTGGYEPMRNNQLHKKTYLGLFYKTKIRWRISEN